MENMGNPPITNNGTLLPPSISSTFSSVSRWSVLIRDMKVADISLDLSTAIEQILRLMQSVGEEYSAGVFLLDESARVVHGSITDMFDRSLYAGRGGLAETMRSSASYILSELPAKPRSPAPGERVPPQPRSQIVVPFHLTAQGRGAIVLRSANAKAFSAADGEALARFALAVSSRIENALLRRKMLQVGEVEVERDLVMAQEIMARLIPRKPPVIPRFEVASVYVPAKVVGGDLVDFISLRDDHYGFLVADVSGNGIPSALLMTGFRALFRGLIKNDFTIRSVFRKLNNQLFDSTAPQEFVSAFYAGLDVSTHRLIYVNGGHVAPLLYRPRHPVRMLDVGGPVLGILPTASYHEDSVVLHPQDILVCFSDGLSEVENAAGDMFDAHRILRVVEGHRTSSAEDICGALQEEATKFAGHTLRDDLSILVLKFP
jgi:serine phosphatase RsbU (regulator of sigma subunit)